QARSIEQSRLAFSLIAEKAQPQRPPVGEHGGSQHMVGRLRHVVPEDREAIRIERMVGRLPGVVVIGGIVDLERLETVDQRVPQADEDKVPRMGPALAYYSIFSTSPLVVLSIVLARLVFHEGAQRAVVAEINNTLGESVGKAVEQMILNAGDSGATIVAMVL